MFQVYGTGMFLNNELNRIQTWPIKFLLSGNVQSDKKNWGEDRDLLAVLQLMSMISSLAFGIYANFIIYLHLNHIIPLILIFWSYTWEIVWGRWCFSPCICWICLRDQRSDYLFGKRCDFTSHHLLFSLFHVCQARNGRIGEIGLDLNKD